jgi:hypothetical protein
MSGRAGHVEILDRRAIAEMIIHHLIGAERPHEDVAVAHVGEFLGVFMRGIDILAENVLARHVRAIAGPGFENPI